MREMPIRVYRLCLLFSHAGPQQDIMRQVARQSRHSCGIVWMRKDPKTKTRTPSTTISLECTPTSLVLRRRRISESWDGTVEVGERDHVRLEFGTLYKQAFKAQWELMETHQHDKGVCWVVYVARECITTNPKLFEEMKSCNKIIFRLAISLYQI